MKTSINAPLPVAKSATLGWGHYQGNHLNGWLDNIEYFVQQGALWCRYMDYNFPPRVGFSFGVWACCQYNQDAYTVNAADVAANLQAFTGPKPVYRGVPLDFAVGRVVAAHAGDCLLVDMPKLRVAEIAYHQRPQPPEAFTEDLI